MLRLRLGMVGVRFSFDVVMVRITMWTKVLLLCQTTVGPLECITNPPRDYRKKLRKCLQSSCSFYETIISFTRSIMANAHTESTKFTKGAQ